MKAITLAALVALCLSTPALASPGPQVKLTQGTLEGVLQYSVESFKGIPFAAPPVGPLRWRAPQAAPSWQGVRIADHFAPDCLQESASFDDAPLSVKPSEDCLYLNVWRPANAKGPLPVIVMIYGGGMVSGGTSPAIYDGTSFARDGLIFVSMNYRLGRFGYFAFPELTKEDADHGLLGNYGLMDQIAALKWVQANIAAFGGDPARVTIFGESAGGMAVHTMLTSPLSRGLFAGAIIQSGGGRGGLMGSHTVATSEVLGVNFAKANGIAGTDSKALRALRALPADAVTGQLGLATSGAQKDTYGGPMIDGKLLVETADLAYAAGHNAKVPVMVGANSADIGSASGDSKDALFAGFPDPAAAKAAYDPTGQAPLDQVRAEIGMDKTMLEPARLTAQLLASQGLKAYEYRWGYTASQKRASSPYGAPHASELPFMFETVDARYGEAATAQDHDVSRLMHAYWVNFAKTGDPNGAGLPVWPAYDAKADRILEFSPDGQAVPEADPLKARFDATAAAAK